MPEIAQGCAVAQLPVELVLEVAAHVGDVGASAERTSEERREEQVSRSDRRREGGNRERHYARQGQLTERHVGHLPLLWHRRDTNRHDTGSTTVALGDLASAMPREIRQSWIASVVGSCASDCRATDRGFANLRRLSLREGRVPIEIYSSFSTWTVTGPATRAVMMVPAGRVAALRPPAI